MFDTTDEEGWTSHTEEAMESPAKDLNAILATPKQAILATPKQLSSMPATPRIAICSEELSLHWSDSGGEGDEEEEVGADDAFTGVDNVTLETSDNTNMNLEVNMVTMETMS